MYPSMPVATGIIGIPPIRKAVHRIAWTRSPPTSRMHLTEMGLEGMSTTSEVVAADHLRRVFKA